MNTGTPHSRLRQPWHVVHSHGEPGFEINEGAYQSPFTKVAIRQLTPKKSPKKSPKKLTPKAKTPSKSKKATIGPRGAGVTKTTKPNATMRGANSRVMPPPKPIQRRQSHFMMTTATTQAKTVRKPMPTTRPVLNRQPIRSTLSQTTARKTMANTTRKLPLNTARKSAVMTSEQDMILAKLNEISNRLGEKGPTELAIVKEIPHESNKISHEVLEQQIIKNTELLTTLSTLQIEMNQLKTERDLLESQLSQKKIEITTMKTSLETQVSEVVKRETTIRELNQKINLIEYELTKKQEQLSQTISEKICVEQERSELLIKVKELEQLLIEDEAIRRQMHNTIQELKGNIRVFCRVRPMLQHEVLAGGNAVTFPKADRVRGQREITVECNAGNDVITGEHKSKSFTFSFDKVFKPSTTQAEVFSELSQLVQSVLDGYNCCIFAYGQTGGGKTYTMEGEGVEGEHRGMIARAVEQIFTTIAQMKNNDWSYTMVASFLEIYNETIQDLLFSDTQKKESKHAIKHSSNGKIIITDIQEVTITSSKQIFDLLKLASKNRSVGGTMANAKSSRSHSIFRLKLTGTNATTHEVLEGLLNLVDLAGSERLSVSKAEGDRLQETKNINKSLSGLGDVIQALVNKEPHIPFRNTKLTHVLQDSLGGNSKCLMFVNVSPNLKDANETINSLRFATKVNDCVIGTATKQVR